jgi:hypothetical protein
MKKRAEEKTVRKEYNAPKVTVYGKVSDLTQGGNGRKRGRGNGGRGRGRGGRGRGHGGSRS